MAEEVLDFLEFLEEVDYHNERHARARVTRSRSNWFETYDDTDFFKRYRMQKSTALWILDQIAEDLEYMTDRNQSVPPVNQLLITLRFYATGSHLIAIGDMHGVDVSTVSRIVKKVTNAIIKLRNHHIKLPTTSREIQENQSAFYAIAGFPYVVGTLDCTHVKIQSPGGNDAELFRNRKGYFSINVQTVSDANLKVQNVVARWPGSTHDSAIFTNSRVCQQLISGTYGRQALLLGDNGYPLKNYLITPFLNPRSPAQERFNKSQIKTRNTVERQYGVIKRRFPALAMGLRIKLETACNVVIACCILHNICIDFREDMPPTPDELNEEIVNYWIQMGQIEHEILHGELLPNATDRRTLITQNFFGA